MTELNINIVPYLLSGIGAIGLAFLGLFVWGIKKVVTTTFQNTVALKVLSSQLGQIQKMVIKIPLMEDDINEAHAKIRQIVKTKGDL